MGLLEIVWKNFQRVAVESPLAQGFAEFSEGQKLGMNWRWEERGGWWMCTASPHFVRGRRYVGCLAIPRSASYGLTGREKNRLFCKSCGCFCQFLCHTACGFASPDAWKRHAIDSLMPKKTQWGGRLQLPGVRNSSALRTKLGEALYVCQPPRSFRRHFMPSFAVPMVCAMSNTCAVRSLPACSRRSKNPKKLPHDFKKTPLL